ncbi:hypothetical protein CYMTET_9707 [Cymbomonas tetramitiformis]|uniref:Uncharacterized protein n=1 Tax=Cymbomonas tetramitiformis TaxID=36881 RepID=A0AAE0GR85_9CHLO|nr:hypothetical protein CYMTET_9707 [Cymbomonas tetramitiformis]
MVRRGTAGSRGSKPEGRRHARGSEVSRTECTVQGVCDQSPKLGAEVGGCGGVIVVEAVVVGVEVVGVWVGLAVVGVAVVEAMVVGVEIVGVELVRVVVGAPQTIRGCAIATNVVSVALISEDDAIGSIQLMARGVHQEKVVGVWVGLAVVGVAVVEAMVVGVEIVGVELVRVVVGAPQTIRGCAIATNVVSVALISEDDAIGSIQLMARGVHQEKVVGVWVGLAVVGVAVVEAMVVGVEIVGVELVRVVVG